MDIGYWNLLESELLDSLSDVCWSLQGYDYVGEPFFDHFRCKRPLTGYLVNINMELLKLCVKTIDDCFNDMNKRAYEPKQIFDEKC